MLSIRIAFGASGERRARVSGIVRAGWGEVERSWGQVLREMGVVGVAVRDFVEREMRRRVMLGYLGRRAESWDRKCVPTPPTPVDG